MLSLNDYSQLVNSWINDYSLPSYPAGLYEPITYMLSGGGKRLRPTLLCASAHAYGLNPEHVKNQALGIELFHNFTLLHDDVMDDADVRHGIPTVHKKWDERTAILSGDTMLTLATMSVARAPQHLSENILALFNKTAIEVYEGQQLDMNFESMPVITEDEYLEMIRLKTSVLLGCATRMGAMLAGADENSCNAMYDFATAMGIAFQLKDDFLDTFGDERTFGKAIGGDIRNNKKTWLWVDAFNNNREKVVEAYASSDSVEKVKTVTELYKELGCDKRCMSLIERYSAVAVDYLDKAALDTESYNFFKEIALKSISRTH